MAHGQSVLRANDDGDWVEVSDRGDLRPGDEVRVGGLMGGSLLMTVRGLGGELVLDSEAFFGGLEFDEEEGAWVRTYLGDKRRLALVDFR
jgi:hypothetical protein